MQQKFPCPLLVRLSACCRMEVDWRAAVCAGIVAGTMATAAQLAMWLLFLDSPWSSLLYRDALFAAALVMGQEIISSSHARQWEVMLLATLTHFTLSIAYAVVLAGFTSRLEKVPALLSGLTYGLVLYGINLHAFTLIFPWFTADRNWITVAAHAVFGTAMAATYKVLARTGGMP